MSEHLTATGERYLPEDMKGEIALEHVHRYRAALDLVRGLDVLDIASGEGYGSNLLLRAARTVVGVDISQEAVSFASHKYVSSNLRFLQGSCAAIPLPAACVDAVVSFETIEHHDEHERMFEELKRVLRPGGFIVISSPDRYEYSDVSGYANPFHVKELYRADFEALLGRWFKSFRLYGQRVLHGSTLFALDAGDPAYERVENYLLDNAGTQHISEALRARYFVAVASDRDPLPALPVGVFVSNEEEEKIANVEEDLRATNTELSASQKTINALQEQLQRATNQASASEDQIVRLNEEMGQWRQHAANLEARIEGQDNAIRQVAVRNAQLTKEAHGHALALIEARSLIGVSQVDDSAAVAQNAEQLDMLRQALDERASHVTALHGELGQRDAQIAALQADIVECNERIGAVHVASDERLALVQFDVSRRDTQIAALASEVARRDHMISELLGSTSWRLMAPLRVARRLAARLKSASTASVSVRSNALAPSSTSAPITVIANPNEEVTVANEDASVAMDIQAEPHDTPEFDVAYYLKRYPDVSKAQLDPYHHYMHYGKAEGRSGRPAQLKLREKAETLRPSKDYVLVVSHEATRTGAPILAWNICRELHHQYNVIVLLLGEGELVEYFDSASDVLVGPYTGGERDTLAISPVVEALCKRYPIRFAIVNSLASRAVLQPLAQSFVPSLLLIHEFFKFHCSPDELVDAMAWAGGTVFSATVVRDSAAIERTRPAANASHIIPQGKSVIPTQAPSQGKAVPKNEVFELIGQRKQKPFIVIGAGTVEYRKGVDLFVATAAEIKRRDPEADILMLWIGRTVDSYRQYADFVAEQVGQADLENSLLRVGGTPDLEAIYQLADACFISSRLDPLPNIAIDAMTAGLPVLCFDRASGVAENMVDDPVASACVLPFLNVEEAARSIIELYRSPDLRTTLSERMKVIAADRFDMKRYVEKLVDLSGGVGRAVSQEQIDIAALENSDHFIEQFYLPPESPRSRDDAIREYVKSSQGRIYARKATPGFYPHAYAESHDLTASQINPFVHFVRAGKPAGPWQERVIDVSLQRPAPPAAQRVALHIHAFYPELLTNILERFEYNELRCDLFISVTSDAVAREARTRLASYARGNYDIRIVPNRGRDIGPLLTEFAADLSAYDVIGHFHTKKSVHVVGSTLVRDWVDFLMENLLGTKYPAARNILSEFAVDPKLGLVFADDPNMIGWDKNHPFAEKLATRMGIEKLPYQFFSFPVGTMFWARPEALKPLFDMRLDWAEYPGEPLPIDGSMLHALERMLPTIARHAGYGVQVTCAPGVSR